MIFVGRGIQIHEVLNLRFSLFYVLWIVLVRKICLKNGALSRTGDIFWEAIVADSAVNWMWTKLHWLYQFVPAKKAILSGQNGHKHRSRRKKHWWNRISAGFPISSQLAKLEIRLFFPESVVSPFFLFFFNFVLIRIASIVWNRRFEAMFFAERASLKSVYGIWGHKSWRNSGGFLQLKSCLLRSFFLFISPAT